MKLGAEIREIVGAKKDSLLFEIKKPGYYWMNNRVQMCMCARV